jgi:hypothetical protein
VDLEVLFNVSEFHVRADLNRKTLIDRRWYGVDIPNIRGPRYKLYRAVAGYLGVGAPSIFQLVFGSAEVGESKDRPHAVVINISSHLLRRMALVPWIGKSNLADRTW